MKARELYRKKNETLSQAFRSAIWVALRFPMDLSNRTILLTGAAQGLGWGIGRRLARAGARMVLVDCDPAVKNHLQDSVFAGS